MCAFDAIGRVLELRRFPVKSLLGETLASADVDGRGLVGDRLWALRTPEGKLGSGKTTRRFQRLDGLLDLSARYEGDVPVVTLPDGTAWRADDPRVHGALSRWVGSPVTLVREETLPHFDDGPVSIVTTASLRTLEAHLGRAVSPRRFRANVLLDVPSGGFPEDAWVGRRLSLGPTVVLQVVSPLARCRMVDLAQRDLPEDADILRTLGACHEARFGVLARVETGGTLACGETVRLD